MIRNLSHFIVLLSCCLLSAQAENAFSTDKLALGAGGAEMSRMMSSKLRSVQGGNTVMKGDFIGSPYLQDGFTDSSLYYDGALEKKIRYRFNAYNQEIEIMESADPGENIFAINKDKKIAVVVDNYPMGFKTFVTSKERTLNGYLITLVDGEEYDLFKREYVKYSPGRPSPNSFVPPVPARFTNFTEYYFQKKDVNRIDEIILSNKKLLKQLDNDTRVRAKVYVKENDLNIKKEGDLIKVFGFLNGNY